MDVAAEGFEEVEIEQLVPLVLDRVDIAPDQRSRLPRRAFPPTVVLLTSSNDIPGNVIGVGGDQVASHISNWRQRCNLPAAERTRKRRRSRQVVCHGIGVVSADFHIASDADGAVDEKLTALLRDAAKTCAGVRGCIVYCMHSLRALDNAIAVADIPHVSAGRTFFTQWIRNSLFHLPCQSGASSLEDCFELLKEEHGLHSTETVLRFETHPDIAELFAKHVLHYDIRPIGAFEDNACQSVYKAFHLLSTMPKHLAKPSKKQVQFFRKELNSVHPLVLESTVGDGEIPRVDLQQVSVETRLHKPLLGVQRCRDQFQPWTKINYAIAAADLRSMSQVARFARRFLSAKFGDAGTALGNASNKSGLKDPSGNTCGRSILRLDMAAMLYNRAVKIPPGDSIELLLDASPLLGREILAVRENRLHFATADPSCKPEVISRKGVPMNLGHCHATGVDKVFALLRSWWLLRGPSNEHFRALTTQVTNFPTDGGSESMCAYARNLLHRFFGNGEIVGDARLFPRAIRSYGWNHNFDLIVKGIVNHHIEWYPCWIEDFRHVIRFVRYHSYTDVLRQHVESIGRHDLLQRMKSIPPNLAKIRWQTLSSSTGTLLRWREVLMVGFSADQYDGSNVSIRVVGKITAGTDEATLFWMRCIFVNTLFSPVEKCRTWGTGCSCHEAERLEGRKINCSFAGRRATEAWQAIQNLRDTVMQAPTANEQLWSDDFKPLWDDFVRCNQLLNGRIFARWKHLNELPYMLVRARDPAIMQECLQRAARAPALDQVSQSFLSVGAPLYFHCVRLATHHECTDILSRMLQPYEHMLLDESPIEGEHRDISMQTKSFGHLSLPMAIAKARMRQNEQDADNAKQTEFGRKMFLRSWRNWKMVAELPGKCRQARDGIPAHVPMYLYSMPPADVIRRCYRLGNEGLADFSDAKHMVKSIAWIPSVSAPQASVLAIEWIKAAAPLGNMFSLPVDDDDNFTLTVIRNTPDQFPKQDDGFQPAEFETQHSDRYFFVPLKFTIQKERLPHTDEPINHRKILVQPFHRWRPSPHGQEQSVELYKNADPEWIDPLSIAPWQAWHHCLRSWASSGPSDLAGCVGYVRGDFASPPALTFDKLPILTQLHQLAALGWQPTREETEPHKSSGDMRLCLWPNWAKAATYLQCLHKLPELLDGGLPGLHLRQLNSYYLAALTARNKSLVLPGMQNKAYLAICAAKPEALPMALQDAPAASDDEFEAVQPMMFGAHERRVPLLAGAQQPPLPAQVLPLEDVGNDAVADVLSDSNSSGVGFEDVVEQVFMAPRGSAPVEEPPGPATPIENDILLRRVQMLLRLEEEWKNADLPGEVENVRIQHEARLFATAGTDVYNRIRVTCPVHASCGKSRSLTHTRRYGPKEAWAFLGAWVQAAAAMSGDDHKVHVPSADDVKLYLRQKGMLPDDA